MPLSDYLASKYLNAESSATSAKKRKRSKHSTTTGLIIADDDALGWTATTSNADDDDGRPTISSTTSAEFRKAKKNAWKVVGTVAPKDAEQAQADAIIAAASAENAAAAHQDEEPAIADDDGVIRMESGAHAGLQSAAAVTRQFEEQKRRELAQFQAEERAGKIKSKKDTETVYRDATGRRIDISMRRAEARKEADRKAEEEKEKADQARGDVQLRQREKRKEEVEEARFMTVARGVDDEGVNKELREKERWNDPAAQFLTRKETGAMTSGETAAAGNGKKTYKGAAMPNRYGIRPGWRWDGVDRGNGWEGERFKALNRKTRNKELDFAWQTDT